MQGLIKLVLVLSFVFISEKIMAQNKDSIEPISSCVSEIFLPNAFTGNGDSVNDIFIPRLAGEPQNYLFKIFNRWGEVIFETNKVTEGWNGSYKNKAVQMDVYVWIIEFTCKDDEQKYKFTGHVTLIR